MEKYYYKNKNEVKVEDICFYSEWREDSDYHYANSIIKVVEGDEGLSFVTLYFSNDDGMTFIKNTDSRPISLKFTTNQTKNDRVLVDFIYIGWGNEAYTDEEDL